MLTAAFVQYVDHVDQYGCGFGHKNTTDHEKSFTIMKKHSKVHRNNRNDYIECNKIDVLRERTQYMLYNYESTDDSTIELWNEKLKNVIQNKINNGSNIDIYIWNFLVKEETFQDRKSAKFIQLHDCAGINLPKIED